MTEINKRPKIGIALSGGAGRAVGHVAILDVFKEHGITPDILVGCSSGALVAVSYAAGTLDYLRNELLTMTGKKFWNYLSMKGARGGLFQVSKGDSTLMKITGGYNFEDLPIKVGVTAADIENGNLVTITTGNLMQGIKATVAIPGLFEPVVINNRILLEGGLVNIVPTLPARQLGADIVIGVDVAKAKFFFQKRMPLFRMIRRFRRLVGIDFVKKGIIKPISSQILDHVEKQFGVKRRRVPNALRIFFMAVDRSYNVEDEWNEEKRSCDMMIEPPVKETGRIGISESQFIYDECRKAALEALPQVKKLIADFEAQRQPATAELNYDKRS